MKGNINMKRNTVGAVALCLMMIATAVAGAAPAKQDQNPSQAGKSPVYFYDVAASDTHGKGKLMIDVDKHTFVFNGQDFEPSVQITLRSRTASSDPYVLFAIGKTTPSGNLHLSGNWEPGAAAAEIVAWSEYPLIDHLDLFNCGGYVAQLASYWSEDSGATWHMSEVIKGISLLEEEYYDLYSHGVPLGAWVKIHIVVVGGKDRTGSDIFINSADTQYGAYYNSYGPTWNASLEFQGLYE
jgi:hypothetical protein